MIRAQNLSFLRGEKRILSRLNLSIPTQGVTAVVGPNGAGKSTLLSLLCGVLAPTSGEVSLAGKLINAFERRELAKQLAFLRQDNHLNARLTVRELVCFGRFPHHRGQPDDSDWRQIDEAIEQLDLSSFANRYLDELSGGQRQRAFIAMVMAQDTPIILLDEPLNNLDMKHSVAIMKKLRAAAEAQGKSIVVVIHDINFAGAYADHIIALKQGELFFEGDAKAFMQEDVLAALYDMPIQVQLLNGTPFALYTMPA